MQIHNELHIIMFNNCTADDSFSQMICEKQLGLLILAFRKQMFY